MRTALRRHPFRALLMVLAAALAAGGTALAQAPRQTTAQGEIAAAGAFDPAKPGFNALGPASARKQYLRELGKARAQRGRTKRRTSLVYLAQINDLQLADEESPARIDSLAPVQPNTSAWRPQEALMPQTIDAVFKRLNAFTAASPNRGAKGKRATMSMALMGGDQADNQQENETVWTRQLMEGGQALDPNSGVDDTSACTPAQRAELASRPGEAARYTGVQDYDDYNGGAPDGNFYDPDQPAGTYGAWPAYPGLMDLAQRAFVPAGLRKGGAPVPTYVTNGNHDGEVQGYVAGTQDANRVATGCFKPFISNPTGNPPAGDVFAAPTGFTVPPDPRRRFVDRGEVKRIFAGGSQGDAHGFAFVDPAQNAASGGNASYYAWSPKPGLRFISLDTVSEGSAARGGAEGNLDDPQFQWLRGELRRAKATKQIVVVFGHHPIRRLIASTSDETAGACTDAVGCDSDPRNSSPIHLRADVERLFNANANMVAYLSGHTHVNRIRPCATRCRKGNWWSVETASVADFPQQAKLIEVMDNQDGTLSILGTQVDHAGGVRAPAPTPDAGGTSLITNDEFASLSRTLAANDPRGYRNPGGGKGDRNVELMVRDPFAGRGAGLCAGVTRKTTGRTVNGAVLNRKRSTVRRTVTKYALRAKSSRIDRYCLVGRGNLRVGYVRNRSVLALSSNKSNRLSGIKVGSRTKTVRKRLRGERAFRSGASTWYVARASRARIVVEVRRGKVRQMGLADKRRASTRRKAAALIRGLGF